MESVNILTAKGAIALVCELHQRGVAFSAASASPFTVQQDFAKTTEPICTETGGGMDLGPGKNPLHSGADLAHLL